MKFLMIDDEESILKLFTLIFKSNNHEIDTAVTINDALKLITNDYDYILVDYYMDNDNTIELIKEILKKYSANNVFVLSGLEDKKEYKKLHKIGVIHFMKKPITYKQIIEKISQIN